MGTLYWLFWIILVIAVVEVVFWYLKSRKKEKGGEGVTPSTSEAKEETPLSKISGGPPT